MPNSTVHFSVPEEIKQAFDETFASENKSAIIAHLMQQAIDDRQRQQRRATAIDAMLEMRRTQRPASETEVAEARRQERWL